MTINLEKAFKFTFGFSLFWLIIEGVLRKWLLPGFSSQLFYLKYVFFGISYFLFFLQHPYIKKPTHLYQFFILLYFIWCLIEVFNNSLNNSFLVPLVGFIVHGFFIPLTFVVPYYFSSFEKLEKFIKWMFIISIPISILGFFQFYLPVDHFLNKLANENQLFSRAGGYTRISSVFSFIKIYNAYLLFSSHIFSIYIIIRLFQKKSILFYFISLILVFINNFMTSSRLAISLMIINIILLITYVFFNIPKYRNSIFFSTLIFIIGIVFLYNTSNYFRDPIDATIKRFQQAESRHRTESTGFTDVQIRVKSRVDLFKFSNQAGFIGYGIGTAYQGSQGLMKNKIPFYFEEEAERLILDLGIIGVVVLFLMRFFIFLYTFASFLKSNIIEHKVLLFGITIYFLPIIFSIEFTTYNYLENIIYWFLLGLVISLNKMSEKKFIDENSTNS